MQKNGQNSFWFLQKIQRSIHITYVLTGQKDQNILTIFDKTSHCALPCFFQALSLAFVIKARSLHTATRMKPLGSTWPCISLSMNTIHYLFKKPLWIYYIVENMRRKFPFKKLLQSLLYALLLASFFGT